MSIEEYKLNFDNPSKWFIEEVEKGYHKNRIAKVLNNRNYLKGRHKVLGRENAKYKGKELITRKTIIQYAKTILNFHSTYLLGKPLTITGKGDIVDIFTDIYKLGQYNTIDYKILDRVNKFGDSYEVVYIDNGIIKSRVLDSADSYPVYDDRGNYIAFIEYWTDTISNISYWNVYYPTYTESWSNEKGTEELIESKINVCGLPIHYHNFSDEDYLFGESMLDDIRPLLDELEDIYSKLGDAIYVNTLNPMPVAIGQRVESTIPADATGYILNLDTGDYKVVNATMDYNNIKYYIDTLRNMINEIGAIPAVLSSGDVANVSEMSLKMLFHMANIKAMDTEKWLSTGLQERFTKWRKVLNMQGINADNQVGIEFNLSIPVATDEVTNNLKTLREVGAISIESIMEKSDLIKDIKAEKERLKAETTE